MLLAGTLRVMMAAMFFIGLLALAGCVGDEHRQGRTAAAENSHHNHGAILEHTEKIKQTDPTLTSNLERTHRLRNALDGLRGVEKADVMLDGGTVYVQLVMQKGLTIGQIEEIRDEAKERLTRETDRYHYEVNTSEDRWFVP